MHRSFEDGEGGFGGGNTIGRGVELFTHLAQRVKNLGSQHNHQQTGEEVDIAVEHPNTDFHRHDGDAQGSEELENPATHEGYSQSCHGGTGVFLTDSLDLLGRGFFASQGLESGESR